LFSESYVPVGDTRPYSVLVSIVAHSLIIAAAIIVPVMASDIVVPARYAMITFRDAPPLPPPMPPPNRVMRTPPPDVQRSIPVVAPDGIANEAPAPPPDITDAGPAMNAGIVDGGAVPGLLAPASPAPIIEPAPLPVGGNVQPPTKVRDVAPVYPAIARAARVAGVVIISATIGRDGKVQDARVLRSIPLLDAAALDAVRQWEYTPTRLNGAPVAVVMTVTVNFRLQ
jgi:protein TonB